MNRKDFLRRVAMGLAAAAVAPAAAAQEIPPKLYGDGIHDDTDAIQWRVDRGVPIRNGRHLVTDCIVVGTSAGVLIENNEFIRHGSGATVYIREGVSGAVISGNRIVSRAAARRAWIPRS